MAQETEVFKLDLDAADFLDKAKNAKEALQTIGAAKNLEGLIQGISSSTRLLAGMAAAVGVVAAEVYAMKAAMDLVFAAEDIKAVNQQFETLTENAGIAGGALKKALEEAANGLIDDTELLKLANKALVDMGASAKQLPAIMETARKATAVMGGDLLTNVETITRAINTGQLRALKQLGLDVRNVDVIYREHAKTLGVATAALDDNGKRQAILNAVLEKGKTAFRGVNADAKEAQTTWQQTKVALSQLAEAFILAFDKTVGPTIKNYLKGLKDIAQETERWATAKFGEGPAQAAAQVGRLSDEITKLQGKLVDLEMETASKRVFEHVFGAGSAAKKVEELKNKINELRIERDTLELEASPEADEGDGITARMGGRFDVKEKRPRRAEAAGFDANEQLRIEAKLQSEIVALRRATFEDYLRTTDEEAFVKAASEDLKRLAEEETNAKISELKALQLQSNVDQGPKIIELQMQLHAQLLEIEDNTERARMDALDRLVSRSQTAADGISKAFRAGTKKAEMEFKDFGKRGEAMFTQFSSRLTAAFSAAGAEGANVGKIMKSMFLNVLADRAEAEGSLLLLSGLWPPNPLALGAGAGLLALGGFLRSQAGGGGGGAKGGGAGGGAGPEGGYKAGELSAASERPELAPEAYKRREVTVQIQGNYIEHPSMQEWLVDQIRKETDATAFKYEQVGE